MNLFPGKYYNPLKKILLTIIIFLSCYAFIKYLLPFFTPFIIAVIIALINEPAVAALEKRARLPRPAAAALTLLVSIAALGLLLLLGITKMYNELVRLQGNLVLYMGDVSNFFSRLTDELTLYYDALPGTLAEGVSQNLKNTVPKLQSFIDGTVSQLLNFISSIPKLTLYIATTLLAAYFLSSDRREIRSFIYKQLPRSWSRNFTGVKVDTFSALLGYFKAMLFLMSITFVEVTAGLFLIKADYALLMGLIVALSDAIPVLGTGMIFVPWIGWSFLTGNIDRVFGLSIIYLVGVIVRQILEPKIIGSQIGLHPLATLTAMYIGLELFGLLGMFIGPISIIILRSLQESGVVRVWRD